MPQDVSYTPHHLGGVTEHRVYQTKQRPPAVTLGLLALHGYAAWRLWQADLSVRALRSLSHWDWAAWRQLVSVQSLVLVVYLVILLKISDQLVYGKFPGSSPGNWVSWLSTAPPDPRIAMSSLAPSCARALMNARVRHLVIASRSAHNACAHRCACELVAEP